MKLVSAYTLLHWQRVSKLIHHPALGDQSHTPLMDAMLALLLVDEAPGSLFLERLPVEMRDHLVATSPAHALTHDGGDTSPVRWSQTPGPAASGDHYFYKHFGISDNNCQRKGNARANGRRMNEMVFLSVGSIFISKIPSNREFLVNTGASCSVFPHHSSAPPSGPRLLMADGCPTKSWGSWGSLCNLVIPI